MNYPLLNVKVVANEFTTRVSMCEFKDCGYPAKNFTMGGDFGTVLHCDFHAIRCVCDGYATGMKKFN